MPPKKVGRKRGAEPSAAAPAPKRAKRAPKASSGAATAAAQSASPSSNPATPHGAADTDAAESGGSGGAPDIDTPAPSGSSGAVVTTGSASSPALRRTKAVPSHATKGKGRAVSPRTPAKSAGERFHPPFSFLANASRFADPTAAMSPEDLAKFEKLKKDIEERKAKNRADMKALSSLTRTVRRHKKPEVTGWRDIPCSNCVNSRAGGRSDGRCGDTGGERCHRCGSGGNPCLETPYVLQPFAVRLYEERNRFELAHPPVVGADGKVVRVENDPGLARAITA